MFIYNNSLSEYEKAWLESLLSINFINREGIIYQINHSQVESNEKIPMPVLRELYIT